MDLSVLELAVCRVTQALNSCFVEMSGVGVGYWSGELDRQLALLVRQFSFDFVRVAAELQRTIRSSFWIKELCSTRDFDELLFSPRVCRARWAFLDYQVRDNFFLGSCPLPSSKISDFKRQCHTCSTIIVA